MPGRKKSKSKRSTSRKFRIRKRSKRHQPVIIQPVYYVQRASDIRKPQPRPHHYEYSSNSNSVHEHLNRVNYSPEHELTVQDRMQRKLKQNAENYRPNYMHVSSEELAIPAPRRVNGMRMFTNI